MLFPIVVIPELDKGSSHEREGGPSILRQAQDAGRRDRSFIFGRYFFSGYSTEKNTLVGHDNPIYQFDTRHFLQKQGRSRLLHEEFLLPLRGEGQDEG
jgi:hypothetical protein